MLSPGICQAGFTEKLRKNADFGTNRAQSRLSPKEQVAGSTPAAAAIFIAVLSSKKVDLIESDNL